MLTTFKVFGISTVLACGTGFCVSDAQACGGSCCCRVQRNCCAPTCAAPAAVPAPATDVPPPPMEPKASMEGRQRYQSAYQAAPTVGRPMPIRTPRTSQLGADRKFLGKFGE